MSCVITYKGQKYSEEQFKEYFINNKQEFATSIAKNKNVMDSFKRKMEGIDYIFSQSPEIASIGNKAQYLQYLSTIFPDSKVKDIVYHGSNTKFDKFDISKATKGGSLSYWLPKGYYFSNYYATANAYSDKKGAIYHVILNLKSPTIITNPSKKGYGIGDVLKAYIEFPNSGKTNQDLTDAIEKLKTDLLNQGDSVIVKDVFDMPQGSPFNTIHHWSEFERKDETDTLVVFEPEQIHILGSKQDIEGFKEFANNKNKPKITIDQLAKKYNILETNFFPKGVDTAKLKIEARKLGYDLVVNEYGSYLTKDGKMYKPIQPKSNWSQVKALIQSELPDMTEHEWNQLPKAIQLKMLECL